MEIKLGNEYPAGTLSNLAAHKFTFRGVECNSMEGLLQGLKFKGVEMQREICTLTGTHAKKSGAKKNWQQVQTLWWQGEPIKRRSDEYQELLDEAYDCLFRQNEKARNALLATNKAVLKHSIGRRKANETVLTQQEFCSRLTKMRELIKSEEFLEF
jgi:predicted NAD-dependent protein-ADP-ribosyltransferase YbiA (DUF1768 family)